MDHELVGREESLTPLDRFIDGVAAGGGRMVIEGEAGVGKTAVWQWAVDRAAGRGYRTLVCRTAESESGLAYSGLADLLAGVETAQFKTLPEPQRQALQVALLLAAPTGRPLDARAVYTAFAGVLQALAEDVPVLLAVDDEQWLDPSSRKALEYALRRVAAKPVGIIATTRSEFGGVASPTQHEETLRLGPLSPGALHRLIKLQTQVSLSRTAVLRVHRLTGGNPFYALEVAEALARSGLPDSNEPWPIPDDLRQLAGERLERVTPAERRQLLTAAASTNPTLDGLDKKAIAAAEQARIVTVAADGRVRFTHPLFAQAIYDHASQQARRQVHEHLAANATEIEEQARHRALAATEPDEGVATLLEQAATAARNRGAPDIAAEFEERAVALTPLVHSTVGRERALRAASYHFHAGDLQRSRTLLLELLQHPTASFDRAPALLLLGESCYRLGLPEEALGFLRRAVDTAGVDAPTAITAELAFSFVTTSATRDYAAADAAAQRALTLAQGLGDDALLAAALAASVYTRQLLGQGVDEEQLERALAREDLDQPGSIERRPSLLAGVVLCAAEQYDRARAILERLRAHLVAAGSESDLPYLLIVLALVASNAGDLLTADVHAEAAGEIAAQAGSDNEVALAQGMLALVFAQLGRIEQARAAAADAIARSVEGCQASALWAAAALAHLEVALGNNTAALAALACQLEQVEEDGVADPSRTPFLPDAIEALVQTGELERAERLTETLEERASTLGRPAATLAAARCRALLHAARGEVEAALDDLDRVLAETPALPEPLTLARSLIVKGQLERRRKDKRRAAASLQQALRLCEQLGANLWAQRAETELERLGTIQDPDELTPTELQVARLAGSGLSNREIAVAAFISQKTVEANMSRIYRKLGIHSRAELATWLAERDRAGDAPDVNAHVLQLGFADGIEHAPSIEGIPRFLRPRRGRNLGSQAGSDRGVESGGRQMGTER